MAPGMFAVHSAMPSITTTACFGSWPRTMSVVSLNNDYVTATGLLGSGR
jgi:hypothetical protein